jgi:hypothetical protein
MGTPSLELLQGSVWSKSIPRCLLCSMSLLPPRVLSMRVASSRHLWMMQRCGAPTRANNALLPYSRHLCLSVLRNLASYGTAPARLCAQLQICCMFSQKQQPSGARGLQGQRVVVVVAAVVLVAVAVVGKEGGGHLVVEPGVLPLPLLLVGTLRHRPSARVLQLPGAVEVYLAVIHSARILFIVMFTVAVAPLTVTMWGRGVRAETMMTTSMKASTMTTMTSMAADRSVRRL